MRPPRALQEPGLLWPTQRAPTSQTQPRPLATSAFDGSPTYRYGLELDRTSEETKRPSLIGLGRLGFHIAHCTFFIWERRARWEDSDPDVGLLIHSLTQAGLSVVWKQAQSASELRTLLAQEEWDVVIADFSLPQFSAMAALVIIREHELDVPFIVVSGVVGEETAVEAMRAGAHDFVTKHKLARLAPVVEREVRGARERKLWKAGSISNAPRRMLTDRGFLPITPA